MDNTKTAIYHIDKDDDYLHTDLYSNKHQLVQFGNYVVLSNENSASFEYRSILGSLVIPPT